MNVLPESKTAKTVITICNASQTSAQDMPTSKTSATNVFPSSQTAPSTEGSEPLTATRGVSTARSMTTLATRSLIMVTNAIIIIISVGPTSVMTTLTYVEPVMRTTSASTGHNSA